MIVNTSMFKKIKNINVTDFSIGELNFKWAKAVLNGEDVPALQYNYVTGSCCEQLLRVIPNRYHKNFYPYVLRIAGIVWPHTDSGVKVSINYYHQTNNELTTFYKVREGATGFKKPESELGRNYLLHEVEPVNSFLAKDNDTYILDVTKPHSVTTLQTLHNRYRIILILQTNDYTYEEVLEMLEETNSI